MNRYCAAPGVASGSPPAGQLLQAELEAALSRIAQAVDRVAERRIRLTLNINVTPSFAARCLIPRLSSFCRKNPAIDLRIDTSRTRLDFDPQEYDISIRSLYPREARILRRRRDWQSAGLHPFLEEANWQRLAEWGSRWEQPLWSRKPSRRAR